MKSIKGLPDNLSMEQLRAFHAVARCGSFSAAAARIHRTQSAVSVQVARLEEALGHRLFDRSNRSVDLTDAGEVLRRYVLQLEELFEDVRVELDDLRGKQSGRLVLCTSDTSACYRLPQILQQYRTTYPGVELAVQNATSPRTIDMVLANTVDFGIVTLNDLPKGLEAIPLFERSDVVVCHPAHPLAGRESLLLKDLEAYTCILLDQNCSTRRLLDAACLRSRVALSISMELSSVEVIKRFVRIDAGVSVVPDVAVAEECERGDLCRIPIADYVKRKPVPIGLIHLQGKYLSFAARSFLRLGRDASTQNR